MGDCAEEAASCCSLVQEGSALWGRALAAAACPTQPKYLAAARRCADVVWHRGLLKKGDGLCHGIAGNAYSFLALARFDAAGAASGSGCAAAAARTARATASGPDRSGPDR